MSAIKSFAFSLGRTLSIKRSHCYELIAGAFGYRSYAAVGNSAVFIPSPAIPAINHAMINERASSLGIASDVLPEFISMIVDQRYWFYPLDDLISRLEIAPYDGDSKPLILALEPIAETDDARAHYALGLIHWHNLLGAPPADYWYNKRQSGAFLSDVENRFADEYEFHESTSRLCGFHLNKAGDLGEVNALWKLIEWTHESEVAEELRVSPANVRELLHAFGGGDVSAIKELAIAMEDYSPVMVYALIEFARLLNSDITAPHAEAIDDHGNSYDDDVGGPMHVIYEDGLEAPDLSDEDRSYAVKTAQDWLTQLNVDGKADIKFI